MDESIAELGRRVTAHGREIDDHSERIVKLEAANEYNQRQMQRILDSQASISGKLDTLNVQIMQVASRPDVEKAEQYDQMTQQFRNQVITQIIGMGLMALAMYLGLR